MKIGAGKTVFNCEDEHSNNYVNVVKPCEVQGDSERRVNILVCDGIGHCEEKKFM